MKAVIFDFDGTIADNFRYVEEIVARLAPKYGFSDKVSSEVVDLKNLSMKQIVSKYHISKFNVFRMLLDGRREMKKFLGDTKMPSGMKGLLEGLIHDGVKVAIISSNSRGSIQAFLEQNGIVSGIDIDSSIHLFGKSKPILKYLKQNRISPNDSIYVGDEVRDIDAGREAGIATISVTWGYNSADVLAKENNLIANTVAELGQHIEKHFK